MTKEQLIDRLVINYGLSLKAASWVDNWIQHFIDEAVKEANKNFIKPDVINQVCQCTNPLSKPEKEYNKCFNCDKPIK